MPQFILEQAVEAGQGGATNIIVTQPRRISALGLAHRVASERGEEVRVTVCDHVCVCVPQKRKKQRDSCWTCFILPTAPVHYLMHCVRLPTTNVLPGGRVSGVQCASGQPYLATHAPVVLHNRHLVEAAAVRPTAHRDHTCRAG